MLNIIAGSSWLWAQLFDAATCAAHVHGTAARLAGCHTLVRGIHERVAGAWAVHKPVSMITTFAHVEHYAARCYIALS